MIGCMYLALDVCDYRVTNGIKYYSLPNRYDDNSKTFWGICIIPIGLLAIQASWIMGAALFASNRVNIGKFLVTIRTRQGLFTTALRIIPELWSGHARK